MTAINIGTDKQIALAKDIAARPGAYDAAALWISGFRATIINSGAPQDAKDKAAAALDKLPSVAAFWIEPGHDYEAARIAICVVAGQDPASLGSESNARGIFEALQANT